MIGVVFVLAMASALRYYLVTTLGERIVTDLREQVFSHLTALSPAFFDRAQTGEMMSRLTADTTQIKAAVGASVSVALRNLVLFIGAGAMMVITSPKLSLFVLAAIPVIVLPLVAFGRAVRQRSRARAGFACRCFGLCGRDHRRGARTLQAFTSERLCREALSAMRSRRAFEAARQSTLSRSVLTAIGDIPGLRQRRDRAVGRRAGRAGRAR